MQLALCLEQTLGHRAHTANIVGALREYEHDVQVLRIEYAGAKRPKMPWTVAGSLDAWRQLRNSRPAAASLFHTQSVALFAPEASRGRPYVVSLDATPAQMDDLGRWYGHRRGVAAVESAKRTLYRRSLRQAAGVVAWSEWAKRSLVAHYGVPAGKVDVIHPGAAVAFFDIERPERGIAEPVNILFVGGDFERKGGDVLLEAVTRLRGPVSVTLVTTATLPETLPPATRVVSNATPGSPELLAAYAAADIFCLPTRADCTSVAIGEAMAAGLAVVTTNVGSNTETVEMGETGLMVAPDDCAGLTAALQSLVDDGSFRRQLQGRAREAARERMDSQKNARAILAILQGVA